ncbi:MAG: site-specific integrase [Nitrospirae bacterium]|nr:site-specific integrase [Nitrospirota bacterium]
MEKSPEGSAPANSAVIATDGKIRFTKAFIESLPSPQKGKRMEYQDDEGFLRLRITDAGTRTFLVLKRIGGNTSRIVIGRFPEWTIEQARAKALEIARDISVLGKNPNREKQERREEATLDTLFTDYLDRWARPRKKPRSVIEDEGNYRRHLADWKTRKLSEIDRAMIAKKHSLLGKESGPVAANRTLALLSVLFSKALEWGYLKGENPAARIPKFKEQSRDRFLSAQEIQSFLQAVEAESNPVMKDYFMILLLTGARKNNVLSMRWRDIDLPAGTWTVPGENSKNGSPMTVILPPEAVEILRNRKGNGSLFVFEGDGKSGHIVEPKGAWERILKRSGLENVRIHDLRRTLGSWMTIQGTSLSITGRALGHKTSQATSVYARLNLDPVRTAVESTVKTMLETARASGPQESKIRSLEAR